MPGRPRPTTSQNGVADKRVARLRSITLVCMSIIASIAAEYRRYRDLAEGAIAQVDDQDLSRTGGAQDNSIATIGWHLAGNLLSRFTDFLTTDGEKPWRRREEEFDPRPVTRQELVRKMNEGWSVLFAALDGLNDGDLTRSVRIRGQSLLVQDALLRSLAHASYHVGQIIYLAKAFRGDQWMSLSIPRGASEAYNRQPTRERTPSQPDRS